MRKLYLRSPGLVTALALVGACSDPPVFIEITELRAEPAVLSPGESTRVEWRVKKGGGEHFFTWMTLFQGSYDEESAGAVRADEGVTGALALTSDTQGAYVCHLSDERRLRCAADDEDAMSWQLEGPSAPLTLRACTLGIETSDSDDGADCDYATVELALR